MTLKLNGTNSVAAPAYAGDDADTGLQCGTNELKLVTGGTAQSTVDSSGRLLVGTSSALTATNAQYSKFIVRGASSGSSFDGRMSLSRGTAASSLSSGSGVGSIYFTDNDSNEFAAITAAVDGTTGASDAPGRITFATTADGASSPTERIRIDSSGTLKLVSSGGIDFSQIQTNASGMTSETLDSYEEGTWTPIFTSNGVTTPYVSSLFNSYSHQFGKYTKIGRHVIAEFYLQNANPVSYANGGANGQVLAIAGLPFPHGGGLTYPSITVGWFDNWNGWSGGFTPMGYIENGTSYIRMTYAAANGIDHIQSNNVASNSAGILVQVSYTT